MNSTNEYDKCYQENINDMKMKLYSSAEYGADICCKLNGQDEVLQNTSDQLESTDSILDKSIYALRNMTWTGYVHNTIINTGDFVKNNVLSYTGSNATTSSSSSGHTNSNSNRMIHTTFADNNIRDNKSQNSSDKDLEELSSAVETLHSMSVDIGMKLESQAIQIENISERSSQVTDKALALTIQASKLVQSAKYVKSQFIGIYQFVDVETGLYLTANNTSLLLSRATNTPTRFYCYSKGNNIYGLKSEMFMKYIGTSIWGNIIVNSDACGANEECYIDFNDTTTGILMISRNWGSGGWLKRYPSTSDDGSSVSANNRNFETVTETTSSLSDKTNMIRFAAIIISLH